MYYDSLSINLSIIFNDQLNTLVCVFCTAAVQGTLKSKQPKVILARLPNFTG